MGCLHSRMGILFACQCFMVKRIVHITAAVATAATTATAAATVDAATLPDQFEWISLKTKCNLFAVDCNWRSKSFKIAFIKKYNCFCELFTKIWKSDIFIPKLGSQKCFLSFWNSAGWPVKKWLFGYARDAFCKIQLAMMGNTEYISSYEAEQGF